MRLLFFLIPFAPTLPPYRSEKEAQLLMATKALARKKHGGYESDAHEGGAASSAGKRKAAMASVAEGGEEEEEEGGGGGGGGGGGAAKKAKTEDVWSFIEELKSSSQGQAVIKVLRAEGTIKNREIGDATGWDRLVEELDSAKLVAHVKAHFLERLVNYELVDNYAE